MYNLLALRWACSKHTIMSLISRGLHVVVSNRIVYCRQETESDKGVFESEAETDGLDT